MIPNIYDQKEPENFEAIEETQKMKNSLENDYEVKPEKKNFKNIIISIIFIILVIIIVGIIAYNILVKNNKKDKEFGSIQINHDNIQQSQINETVQISQNVQQIQNNEPVHNDQQIQNNEANQTIQNIQQSPNNENIKSTEEIQQPQNNESNQIIQKIQHNQSNEASQVVQNSLQNKNNEINQTIQNAQLTQNNGTNQTIQNLTQNNENNQTIQNLTQNNRVNQTIQSLNQNNETNQTIQNLTQNNRANQTIQSLNQNNETNQGNNNFGGSLKNISLNNMTIKINSSKASNNISKWIHKNEKKHKLPFYDFLPRINKGKDIKNIKDIFKSNRLYINSRDLTIEYIDFIKPIYPDKEEKYNAILFPNLSFDNYTSNHTYNYSHLLLKLEKELKKNTSNTINNKNHIINLNSSLNNINLNNSNNNSIINPGNNLINTTSNLNSSVEFKVNSSMNNNNNPNNLTLTNNSNKGSHNIRNMEELNRNYLKDFYTLCDQRKLINVKKGKKDSFDKPFISIIIPYFNPGLELIKTLRSIQLQTFKNIEIIIVDDTLFSVKYSYKNVLEADYRIRLFTQSRNMGIWRKRIDGFLYSRGQYILHINPGDILADSYILKDLYDLVTKYKLDALRFSFSKTIYNDREEFRKNFTLNKIITYPSQHTMIKYGRPNFNVHVFGYGTIYNRLVRSSIIRKGLDLLNKDLLNAFKDLWEDMWWNDLIDRVSYSNLAVNRLGYIFLYDRTKAVEPRIRNKFLRNRTIREFIYFWYWDYNLLPKYDNKKSIVNTLRIYSRDNSRFCRLPLNLNFLTRKFNVYENLLNSLIKDPFVEEEDKQFASLLLNKTMILK